MHNLTCCHAQENSHDSCIERGLYEYVHGNVHKDLRRLMTGTSPTPLGDRNKIVTRFAQSPKYFAHPLALGDPLRCKVICRGNIQNEAQIACTFQLLALRTCSHGGGHVSPTKLCRGVAITPA